MKKRVVVFLLSCLVALLMSGCSTLGLREGYVWQQRGDYNIITRNDDLYLEKLDGNESKRLTHTPDYAESFVRFVSDGKYIVYYENQTSIQEGKRYIIPADGDDSQRKEISAHQLETLQ